MKIKASYAISRPIELCSFSFAFHASSFSHTLSDGTWFFPREKKILRSENVAYDSKLPSLTSPWPFLPFDVFSGKKKSRKLSRRACSLLSRQIIRISARHSIGESCHGRTGMQSPIATMNVLLSLLILKLEKRMKRKKRRNKKKHSSFCFLVKM